MAKSVKENRAPHFIHLHGHSEKSFKDGHCTFDDIIARAIENEQPGVAVTDHGYAYDSGGFYLKAVKAGIKPLMGCEVYVIPEGASATLPKSDDPDEEGSDATVPYFHLVLLAKDAEVGLPNLNMLLSDKIANNREDGHFYYRPRIKFEDLEKYHEGLICSSACPGGEIGKAISSGNTKLAMQVAKRYKALFGDDYYLEVMCHGGAIKQELQINKTVKMIAAKLGIKMVLTNDFHYARRENYEDHKLLKCISYKENFYDAPQYDKYFPTDDFFIKSDDEMWEIAKEYGLEDAYNNTWEVYNKININIDTKSMHFPKADLSHPKKPGKKFKTPKAKLKWLINDLKPTKYPDDYSIKPMEEVDARIEKELSDISKGKIEEYFLNVDTIISYAKENGMLIGAGRGSAAGSIVANILNIVDVDPLEFDLIWERFWNPGRCVFGENGELLVYSPADIDFDVPTNRREELIDFIKSKWGYDRVASICTFGTYKGRNLVRDGAVALGIDDDIVKQVMDCIPFKGSPTLDWCMENEATGLAKLCEENEAIDDFIYRLLRIQGCSTNASTHAAGVLIADDVVTKYCPTIISKNGVTTQYPNETLEAMGLLKIDVLGHMAEQIIDEACLLIEERHGVKIDPYKIPNDDKETYDEIFKAIRTKGIPQLNANWVIPIIQDVQPDCIEDIIALVTMIRPGSLDSGQTEKYRRACLGKKVKPDVDELEPVVKQYNMCLLYQEQIMELSKQLGGFDLVQADNLRKVCAKKKYQKDAEKMLSKLENGMRERGISEEHISKILEIVHAFFGYSFNKAHAAGYGITSYRMAYLKCHYFVELQTAQLNAVIGNQQETSEYLNELIEAGYKVLPPDVNSSTDVWVCDDEGVRIPLGALDGVGASCVDAIVEERELKGEYKSFEDFVERLPGAKVKVNAIENMIVTGCFSSLGYTIKCLWDAYQDGIVNTIRNAKKGKKLFGGEATTVKKTKEEFDIADIQADEEAVLGFKVTMTEKEYDLLRKQLSRASAKLRGDNVKKETTKKQTARMKAREKMKKIKSRKKSEPDDDDGGEPEESESESDKAKKNDIKSDIRKQLRMKTKVKEDISEEPKTEEGEACLVIVLNDDVIAVPERIKKKMDLLYKNGDLLPFGDTEIVFRIPLNDNNNSIDIHTDVKIDRNTSSKLIKFIKKIVGDDNTWFSSE